jgi:hypothetical protein
MTAAAAVSAVERPAPRPGPISPAKDGIPILRVS